MLLQNFDRFEHGSWDRLQLRNFIDMSNTVYAIIIVLWFLQTVTCKSLILGNGIPIVTTALALSSVKSKPSLTFPLQTATSRAPSEKINHNQHTANTFKQGIWNESTLTSVFTVGCCSSDGLVVCLQQHIKITLATTTWLGNDSLPLLKLVPQTCVHPAVPQFI